MPDYTAPRFDHPPRPMAQRVGAILWPSFFAAGVATMVFFAFVDPLALRDMTFPDIEISRGLYLDEATLRPNATFDLTRRTVSRVIAALCAEDWAA